jgi:two-component system, OmpR family, response regulator TctD
MRVLLLQGAVRVAAHVELVIQQMDFAVDKVALVEEAQAALAVNGYDLLVADLDSLDEDLSDVLRRARSAEGGLRLLVLAGRDRLDAIAAALAQGADDFQVKPIDPGELRLRLSSLSARRTVKGTNVLEYGPLRLHIDTRDVSLDGRSVDLTPRERAVLQILMREGGSVVSKDYIASRVFSMDDNAAPSAIETYVSRLRRKVAHPDLQIRTVHGLGYLLARLSATGATALSLYAMAAGGARLGSEGARAGIAALQAILPGLALPFC